jgi:hypothetical protein
MCRENLSLASVFSRETRNFLGSIVAFQVIDGRLEKTDCPNISGDNLNRPSHLPQALAPKTNLRSRRNINLWSRSAESRRDSKRNKKNALVARTGSESTVCPRNRRGLATFSPRLAALSPPKREGTERAAGHNDESSTIRSPTD